MIPTQALACPAEAPAILGKKRRSTLAQDEPPLTIEASDQGLRHPKRDETLTETLGGRFC